MQVDLQPGTLDVIMRDVLIQDYKVLKEIISDYKKNKNLSSWQEIDLKEDSRYFKAMKTILKYYLGTDWEEIVNEHNAATS